MQIPIASVGMPQPFTFVLRMQIPSGKNAVQITRTGKRYPGKRVKLWRDGAMDQLHRQILSGGHAVKFDGPVSMIVDYVPGYNIRRDVPGLLDALCHLIEKFGLVQDDAQVRSVTWTTFSVQPKRPRCSVSLSAIPPQ